MRVKNLEQFIIKAKLKHGDRYDYSKSVYTGATKKLTITCRKHGDFLQTPTHHYKQNGCLKCRGESTRTTLSEFISKATKIHKGKYNYNLVKYNGSYEKVTITCVKHGNFKMRAYSHLGGQGCKECRKETLSAKFKHNTEDFIRKAMIIHGDKYDYSLVKYDGFRNKVDIICPIHGLFKQSPNNHLTGCDCSKCSYLNMSIKGGWTRTEWRDFCNSKSKRIPKLYVLELSNSKELFYKVGITTRSLSKRIAEIKPYNCKVMKIIKGTPDEIYNLEKKVLKNYRDSKYIPEQKFGGYTECFFEPPYIHSSQTN